jgi:hypothetical protein
MAAEITYKVKGNFKKTHSYLEGLQFFLQRDLLDFDHYGKRGVEALAAVTPVDTGKTASSWFYKVEHETDSKGHDTGVRIVWDNDNVVDGWCKVAVILQYGHATGTGGWVEGIDYINPALAPIFEDILNDFTKEVQSLCLM